MITFTMKGHKH